MTSTARRWAKGCGCGCGLLMLALGLLGWGGFVYVRDVVREAERSDTVMAEVRERHGGFSDFQPAAAGTLPAERVEAFLRSRELMADTRRETEASLSILSSDTSEGTDQVPGLLGDLLEWGLGAAKIEGVGNLLPQVVGFASAKGEALLDAGMGPGEYLYIYSITYFSWLGKSPADGPAFTLVGDDEQDNHGSRGGEDAFDVREGRRESVLTRLNERLLPIMRRQLAAVEGSDGASEHWRARLAAEVTAMESDRFRIPWRDEVPEPLAASLEPYRRQLNSSYSAMCNPLEVMVGSSE